MSVNYNHAPRKRNGRSDRRAEVRRFVYLMEETDDGVGNLRGAREYYMHEIDDAGRNAVESARPDLVRRMRKTSGI